MYFSRSVYLSESANTGLNELIKTKNSNASRIINELIIRETGIARKRLLRKSQKGFPKQPQDQ